MSHIKTSEVIASSPKGWEDAVSCAVERADRTIAGIRDVEITRLSAKVVDGKITEYRAEMKIAFVLDSDFPMHE